MELSPEVLLAISVTGSIIVWLLKLALGGSETPAWVLTGAVYVVAGVLAFMFAPVALPPFPPLPDLASAVPALIQWLIDALVPLSAFAGFAGLVYQALLKRVLEGAKARFAKK